MKKCFYKFIIHSHLNSKIKYSAVTIKKATVKELYFFKQLIQKKNIQNATDKG
jgi:hypothetical protein